MTFSIVFYSVLGIRCLQTFEAFDPGYLEEKLSAGSSGSTTTIEFDKLTFDSATTSIGYNPLASSVEPCPSLVYTTTQDDTVSENRDTCCSLATNHVESDRIQCSDGDEAERAAGVDFVKQDSAYHQVSW